MSLLPFPFYLCFLAVAILSFHAWRGRFEGWGIPMGVVIVTAASWYLGDALYNDYAGYLREIGKSSLDHAWWEVLLFFLAFGVLVPIVNRKINSGIVAQSQILEMIANRSIDTVEFQTQVTKITYLLVLPWSLLMLVALLRTDLNVVGLFFPYLDEKVDPWARDRLGTGVDSLYALAGYLQIMLTALFGVTLALSKRGFTILISGTIYFLSVSFYIFDRTRNAMLAVLLPGFMALVTLRMSGGGLIRLITIIVGFLSLEGWMKFVIENRDKVSVVEAIKAGGTQDAEVKAKKHLGFNMFEELGYINYFIANGTYKVNWGERYFAEIVNPIPRALWPGKPLIGIDYAIARGMAYGNQDAKSGGVACSVSTGMIGQGVVNFGRILGPIAAALLMAIWVAVLARQDLMGNDIGHLLLYAIGLVLTFNMGRDITLLVIYPFVFGWLLLWWNNKRKAKG
jgi:hypothetical protein